MTFSHMFYGTSRAALDECHASRYTALTIKSFRDGDTARVFAGRRARKVPADVAERAAAKMAVMDQV